MEHAEALDYSLIGAKEASIKGSPAWQNIHLFLATCGWAESARQNLGVTGVNVEHNVARWQVRGMPGAVFVNLNEVNGLGAFTSDFNI